MLRKFSKTEPRSSGQFTAKACAIANCGVARLATGPYCKDHVNAADAAVESGFSFRLFVMAGNQLKAVCETVIADVALTYKSTTDSTDVIQEQGGKKQVPSCPGPKKNNCPVWMEPFTFTAVPLDKETGLEIGLSDASTGQYLGRVVIPGRIIKATCMSFEKIPVPVVSKKEKKATLKKGVRLSVLGDPNQSMWRGIRSVWAPVDSRPTADGGVEPAEHELGHLHYILAPETCALNQLSQAQQNVEIGAADEFSRSTQSVVSRAEVVEYKQDGDEEQKAIAASLSTLSAVEKMKALALEKTLPPGKKAQMAEHREKIRLEIISTEKSYCNALTAICDHYLAPLVEARKNKKLTCTDEQFGYLCSNVTSLREFHVNNFLAALERNEDVPKTVVKLCDFLKVYVKYLNDYPKMLEVQTQLGSKRTFRELMKEVRLNLPNDLMSLMIQPVQRVPRYVLLLKELKKFTLVSHPEYEELDEALAKVAKVAQDINEGRRKMEQQSQLVDIQNKIVGEFKHDLAVPGRHLIREQDIKTVHKSGLFGSMKVKKYKFFLMNDSLLWTSSSYGFKGFMSLSAAVVVKESLGGVNGFLLHTTNSKVVLQFDTPEERSQWLADIERLAAEVIKLRKQLRSKQRIVHRHSSATGDDAGNIHQSVAQGLSALSDASGGNTFQTGLIDALPTGATVEEKQEDLPPPKKVYVPRTVKSRTMRGRMGEGTLKGALDLKAAVGIAAAEADGNTTTTTTTTTAAV